MNSTTITLTLTVEQALSAMTAVHGQSADLERLRQDMITNLRPRESVLAVAREAKLLADVERMIKEALNK